MSDEREERGQDVTDRLSSRFGGDYEQGTESSKNSKSTKSSMSESTPKTADESQSDNIRDRPSVLMYLPEDLHKELDLQFDELNLKHKRQFGEALGKNRDYYPAVVQAALEGKELEEVLELKE